MGQRQWASWRYRGLQWHQAVYPWLRSHLWLKRSWFWRGVLILSLSLLVVRSLPYLVPIRASDLVQDQQAIAFSDRQGLPLGTLLTRDQEHTVAVDLNQISPHFLQAIIAAEDRRFYQHGALDERAIVRALLEAVQARQVVSGASTITMQLARMLDPTPRNLSSKLKEIWTSWRLAAGMSKDEILQAYINRLPMGGNVYGVEAAARSYFGIPAQDLTIAQASLLAAIPNDPNRLHPYDHWQALKQRQIYVLDQMVKDHKLTRPEADRVYTETVSLQPRQQGIVAAPHFQFWLASQLQEHPAQVRTTLDRPLQQFVETQVQQVIGSLTAQNVHHAAALVIDNHSGDVLAYVGSPDYFAEAQMGRNDGVQALRQPGSTLKPFLYELALAKQIIRPNTVLADVPTRYAIPGARLYSPSDYSETFQGPVRVRVALANSLNVPAVRILEKVGVPTFLERLHQLGFVHLTHPPEYYGLGLTLGSGEVSLWELAQAYVTIARSGTAIPLNTKILESPPTISPSASPPLSSPTSWQLITDMLSDAHARARAFGVESLLTLPFPAAVKTGTSSDFRDTWTVGFTTDYTVAVWVGNFDSAPMQKVSGVTGAAPLWNRIMLHLHEQREPAAFPVPEGMVQRSICAVSGARPTPACPAIVEEYFAPADLAEYEQQPDPFYQAVQVQGGKLKYRFQLPPEYHEWLAMQPARVRLTNVVTNSGLKIITPGNGDVFLLESTPVGAKSIARTPAIQRLEFKLAAMPTQPVEWRLNGQRLANQTTSSLFWTLQPGNWTLQVRSGEQTDQVQFQVELADARSQTRRGFSFKREN
ncbi:penicillin-binding protein 1C [Pantanalinema sp. GBBB05]|uniref:penicillin-binding protein 1C n=1 Tax=Pantanalinema sp. GBBB05 TaxID=2604139 RepID=UPI001DAD3CA7|nr:penicillin-binding protein 1C [Pantanalinema sp. GBBB05]